MFPHLKKLNIYHLLVFMVTKPLLKFSIFLNKHKSGKFGLPPGCFHNPDHHIHCRVVKRTHKENNLNLNLFLEKKYILKIYDISLHSNSL